MKPYSQMIPRTRMQRLLDYNKRVQNSAASVDVLKEWNLDLDRKLVELEGHRLKPEMLLFGGDRTHQYVSLLLIEKKSYFMTSFFLCNSLYLVSFACRVVNGGWDRECGRGLKLYQSCTPLKRWYILFPNMIEREVNKFISRAQEIGRNMGFEISAPRK